jgi:hypothetical protein
MGWIVITSGHQRSATVYSSEDEAERAAREIAESSEEDIWVAIADQSTKKTRMINVGADD